MAYVFSVVFMPLDVFISGDCWQARFQCERSASSLHPLCLCTLSASDTLCCTLLALDFPWMRKQRLVSAKVMAVC